MKKATAKQQAVQQYTEQNKHQVFLTIINELIPLTRDQIMVTAGDAGVSPTTLMKWRSGDVAFPRFDRLARVAGALGYEIELRQISDFRRLYVVRGGKA